MMRRTLFLSLSLTALVSAGCGVHDGRMVNSAICADFQTSKAPSAGPLAAPLDEASPMDDCVRRSAYSLAGASDTADVVANAAVASCGAVLTRWNQGVIDPSAQAPSNVPIESLSIETGLPTNAMAEHAAFAHRQAVLYVVQARAGRCKPPPVTKTQPNGV